MRRIAVLALIVFAASFGAACQKQEVNIGSGGSGFGPSPTVVVTEVVVTASQLSFTLNSCPSVVILTATAKGVNAPQEFTWSSTGGGEFSHSGNTATIGISRAGEYTGTATSKLDPTKSGTVKIVASGDCGGGTPPPGGVNIHFTATPSTINRGESSRLEWDVTGASACYADGNWTGTRPLRGSVEVSPIETMNYHLHCDGVHKTVTVTVIQPTSPTPPTPPGGGGGGGGGTPTPTPPGGGGGGGTVALELTTQGNVYSGSQGSAIQAYATCTQGGLVVTCPFTPFWRTENPEFLEVNSSTGLVTFKAGTAGNPRTGRVCVQDKQFSATLTSCKPFTRTN